jgi:hypothetical protein
MRRGEATAPRGRIFEPTSGDLTTADSSSPGISATRLPRQPQAKAYEEVNADHGGLVQLVLPDVLAFFDLAFVDHAGR